MKKSADHVPVWEKISLGVGEIPTIGRQSVEQLALPIYNITLGVSPVLVTMALSVTRFIDAFTDPIAGTMSDNAHTRFGRRKPFLFVSALVCAFTLPLIWMVGSGWSEMAYFAYFAATMLAFYVAYSFYNVPLFALAMEATPDYHERTRVAAYKCFFTYGMGLLGSWLFALTQLKTLGGTLHGARVLGLAMGALVLVSGLVPVFFVREGYQKVALGKRGLSLVQGVGKTFSNRAFLFFAVIATGNKISTSILQSMTIYIFIYFVYQGDLKSGAILTGLWGTVYHLSTTGWVPVVTWLSSRLGKIRTLQLCLCVFIIGGASTWLTCRPDMPHLVLISAALIGPGQTAFYTIVRSMIADICDDDELRTGLRREGMYGAMDAWIEKAMASLGVVGAGLLLVAVGFDKNHGGHQAAGSIFHLRLFWSLIPMFGAFMALVAAQFFPITQERALETRRALEERRGAAYAR